MSIIRSNSKSQRIGKMKKIFTIGFFGVLALAVAATSGCVGVAGPTLGIASIPGPVSPYHQQAAEDRAFERLRYERVAILPPITEANHIALDPPTHDQVIRELNRIRPVAGGVPGLEVTYRNIRGITIELIADYVDPVRFVPLIGPVELHHAHYRCTVYFEEVTHVGWPVPHQFRVENGMEVIYIDKDHFHRVGGGEVHSPIH